MIRLRKCNLYRAILLWTTPALFIVVVPLYLHIYEESHPHIAEQPPPSPDLFTPFIILISLAAASSAVDQCVASPVLLVVVCVSQLVVLLVLLNAPVEESDVSAETNSHPDLHLVTSPGQHGIFLQKSIANDRLPLSGKISVVLPCASEGVFTLKTVMSFCDRTPADVLQEIIVVDDGSQPPLDSMLKDVDKRCGLRLLRHKTTMGLMIAKQTGGDAALGKFIGFFDCHVAPNKGWYVELIKLLEVAPQRLVVPTITDLDIDTWDEKSMSQSNSKCYIDWNAEFMWFDDESDYIPVISGGLVATTRDWWNKSGGFDSGMRGWGGENIDQSLRTWLCGGDIVRAKSSRIAHMWRVSNDRRTDVHYQQFHDTQNTARVAAAWFDEFLVKFQHGRLKNVRVDVANVLERKKSLHCKPFAYFLHRFRRVYQIGGVLPMEAFKLKSRDGDLCVDRKGGKQHFGLSACDRAAIFHFANQDPTKGGRCCSGIRQWNTLECFDRLDPTGPLHYYCDVTGKNINQEWIMLPDGRIKNYYGHCLTVSHNDREPPGLMGARCQDAVRWEQIDKFLPEETQLYEDAVKKYGYTDDMPDN